MSKLPLILLATAFTTAANAAPLIINFKAASLVTGSSDVKNGTSGLVARLTLTDAGSNKVNAVLENLSPASGLGSLQFLSEIDLNLGLNPFPASIISSSLTNISSVSVRQNRINGVAGAKFDVGVNLPTSNSARDNYPRLTFGETASWSMTGAGLTSASFNAKDTNNSLLAMLHVQAVGATGSQSTKLFGTIAPTPVPEPASLAALGVGIAGLLSRRKKA